MCLCPPGTLERCTHLSASVGHSDITTRVSLLGELPGEEIVELGAENTVSDELSPLADLGRHFGKGCICWFVGESTVISLLADCVLSKNGYNFTVHGIFRDSSANSALGMLPLITWRNKRASGSTIPSSWKWNVHWMLSGL